MDNAPQKTLLQIITNHRQKPLDFIFGSYLTTALKEKRVVDRQRDGRISSTNLEIRHQNKSKGLNLAVDGDDDSRLYMLPQI
jgi:hypothetical protein